jgi:hypothetical protein
MANHAGLSRSTNKGKSCTSPYTVSLKSDALVAAALSHYKNTHGVSVPWLSFWTVDAPPPHSNAEEVGLAAGKEAAREIETALRGLAAPVRPAYVILDPEGSTCGNPTGGSKDPIAYVWDHLPLKTWAALVKGWDAGVKTGPGLTGAVYLTRSQYTAKDGRTYAGRSYPRVFVAVALPGSPGKATGPNIVGYNAYGTKGKGHITCSTLAADTKEVLTWDKQYNTVQFTDSGADCAPSGT